MAEMTEKNENQAPRANARNRKKVKGIIILLAVALIIAVSAVTVLVRSRTHIKTDNAFVEAHVYTISPQVPGIVKGVFVKENQPVKKGGLLIELDPRDYHVAVSNAKADLALARNQTRADYAQADAARAEVNLARARYEQAEKDLRRGEELFKREVVSKSQFDKIETDYRGAKAQLREAEERLRQSEAVIGSPSRAGKEARIMKAEAALEKAGLNLSYTNLYAPADGYITKKNIEAGNYIEAGQPVMALVALNEVWITANYKESQLTHVRPGQKAVFTVDMYPGKKFTGTVESIMAGTGSAFSLLPPENATGNYVKVVQRIPVRIAVDSATDAEHALRVGMSVEPVIYTGRGFFETLRELNPF